MVHKKSVNKAKSVLDFRFFKAATFYFVSFAPCWHSFSELHEVTWNVFTNSLEGVLVYAEHLLAACPSLCSPTHPKPSQLALLWLIAEAR